MARMICLLGTPASANAPVMVANCLASCELWKVWEVAVPKSEHLVLPLHHDRLPPAMLERLVRNDEMTWPNLVPGPR
jgi:hypothetical protein